MKLDEINMRDPFILPYEGKYYLYGTRVGISDANLRYGKQEGFDVYTSLDLNEWTGPESIFEKNPNFWGTMDFWAPEVHIFKGKIYMFASFKAEGMHRATHILTADRPNGRFTPLTEKPITPVEWECLDGTFYEDKKGRPHIVFCHEWTQIGDGTVCEMQLTEDLQGAVNKPRVLWHASDYKKAVSVKKDEKAFVTDGPYLFRNSEKDLCCIWSSYDKKGYTELMSISDNQEIDGKWNVCESPLFSGDGGHGMIFTDFTGRLWFVMHKPNIPSLERPVLLKIG